MGQLGFFDADKRLAALSDKAKDSVVPLITIPDLEFDFEDRTPKKTVGEHVGTFPKAVQTEVECAQSLDRRRSEDSDRSDAGRMPGIHLRFR